VEPAVVLPPLLSVSVRPFYSALLQTIVQHADTRSSVLLQQCDRRVTVPPVEHRRRVLAEGEFCGQPLTAHKFSGVLDP
jgi:hypothetical protein